MRPRIRHEDGSLPCPSCTNKLLTADKRLQEWFNALKLEFPFAHIAWAFRDELAQNEAYAKGATKVKWPGSAHNNMVDGIACSLALDIFQQRSGVALWSLAFYHAVWNWTVENKYPIQWSGNWKEFREFDHYYVSG